jgi:hypothetical protein
MYYLLPIHSPIYLANYLFTHPRTYDLPIYLFFSFLYNLPTYLPTHLHTTYLPIHPNTYINLDNKCSH